MADQVYVGTDKGAFQAIVQEEEMNLKYKDIAYKINAGDVIAFGGKGKSSDIIRWATNSPVSHVGVILENVFDFNRIVESATINGFSGVSVNFFRDRLNYYDGNLWWLPLSKESRAKFQKEKFYNFLIGQLGKEYDLYQAIQSGVDSLDFLGLMKAKEDFAKFFCSEIVSAALEVSGIVSLNASEQTPMDVCRFGIYESCHRLKGDVVLTI